jgi:hypothetical protein
LKPDEKARGAGKLLLYLWVQHRFLPNRLLNQQRVIEEETREFMQKDEECRVFQDNHKCLLDKLNVLTEQCETAEGDRKQSLEEEILAVHRELGGCWKKHNELAGVKKRLESETLALLMRHDKWASRLAEGGDLIDLRERRENLQNLVRKLLRAVEEKTEEYMGKDEEYRTVQAGCGRAGISRKHFKSWRLAF